MILGWTPKAQIFSVFPATKVRDACLTIREVYSNDLWARDTITTHDFGGIENLLFQLDQTPIPFHTILAPPDADHFI
jgi:hypothetical protein